MSTYNILTITTECQQIAGKYDLTFTTPVYLNSRLRTTLGRVCHKGTKDNYTPYKVEFNESFVKNAKDAEVLETIRHEMAHWIATTITKKNHGHDSYWKSIAAMVGAKPEATYDFEDFEDVESAGIKAAKPKYNLYCGKCLKKIGSRTRKCKVVMHPSSYLSNCCGATILVSELDN